MIIKNCLFCYKKFKARKNKQQYCNKECANNSRYRLVTVHCAHCDASITRPLNKVKAPKTGLNFCNRECKEAAQCIGGLAKLQPPHYKDGAASYKERAIREYGNICALCGITDLWNNRPIILDVHHIDGNRKNGKISNLQVLCPNCHRQEEMKVWAG